MGTSTNRNRLKPSIPLIPDWIDDNSPLSNQNQEPVNTPNEQEPGNTPDNNEHPGNDQSQPLEDIPGNRFYQSQRGFRRVVSSGSGGGIDKGALTRVVKNYVSRAGGGSANMGRRMRRSSGAIVSFGNILSGIERNGLGTELQRLNLSQYINQPVIVVLAALMDVVCGVGAVLDDAITKQAYANTIIRIVEENPNIDLDNLNTAQVSELLAAFLEETIVYRLISDIGRSLTVATCDVERSREIEEELLQIVHGLVHTSIVPELNGALQDPQLLESEIERIYQIAFSSIIDQ